MATTDVAGTTLAEKSPAPTRKLSYASVCAVVIFLVSLVIEVDPQLEQAINVGLPLILAYFVRNSDTPGGYSVKKAG